MNLSGLSAIGPGMQQGQMNVAALREKALAIQQAQMNLDASKRELAGQAALFQGLSPQQAPPGNATPGAQAQPPMPGQSSMPMTTPTKNMPPPQMRPGQIPPPVQGPGVAPALPAGAQTQTPPGGMQQPLPGQGGGQDALSPQGQLQIITQIAQSIKQRSPGIDPQTLFEAVKQQISLMGALSQTQKAQLVLATDQIRAETSTDNNIRTTTTSAENTRARDDTSVKTANIRADASIQNTQARIADADKRLDETQAAINGRQDKSLQGRAAAKVQTERLAVLRSKVALAKDKLAKANASMDQTQISQASDAVLAAQQQVIDFQTKVVGAGAAGPAGGGQQRGPSPATLNGKPIWPSADGKSWVYEDGSEAK